MSKKKINLSSVPKASLLHFSALLKIARVEKKLTLGELAERLNISRPTLDKILNGDESVSIGYFFEAAYILNIQLFDPGRGRFSGIEEKTKKVVSLLPKRINKKMDVIDNDF